MPNPGQELSTLDFESLIGGPLVAVVNAQAQAALSTVNFIKEVGFKKLAGDQNPEVTGVGDPIYVTFKYPKEVEPYQPAVPGRIDSIDITSGGTGYPATVKVDITGGGGGSGAKAEATVANGVVTAVTVVDQGKEYKSAPTATIVAGSGSGAILSVKFTDPKDEVPAKIMDMKLEVPILTMLPIPFIRIDNTTIDFNAKINSVEYRKTDTNIKVDGTLEAKAGWLWGSAKLKVSTSFQRSTQQGVTVDRTYSMSVSVRAVQDEIPAGMERILTILEDAIRGQPYKAASPQPV